MIGNSRPLASLSSALLARKGHAKPAMRPQGLVNLDPETQDDLGWNDMGDEPAPAPHKPVVLRQLEALDEQLAAPEPKPEPAPAPQPVFAPEPVQQHVPEPTPAPVVRLPKAALFEVVHEAKSNKAAFTLRLDADRHLRLRLASALTRRSSQQLVTEALDNFLDSLTEVEALARQIDPAKDHG